MIDHYLLWFVSGMVVGPLIGYLLLAVWLWVSDVVRVMFADWRKRRRPQ